jgi:hypothetical protein
MTAFSFSFFFLERHCVFANRSPRRFSISIAPSSTFCQTIATNVPGESIELARNLIAESNPSPSSRKAVSEARAPRQIRPFFGPILI